MKLMKKIFLTSLFFLSAFALMSQKIEIGDSVTISFQKMDEIIIDSNNFYIKIVSANISRRPIYVYEHLTQGDLNDRFRNVNMILEKEVNGKYLAETKNSYRISNEALVADSLRHFDLPKKQISSLTHDTLLFNLLKLNGYFDAGNYRVKINLRIQTIRDTTEYHQNPDGSNYPPEDKIKYVASDWIYFRLPHKIYVRR
jgi:hypothetical protein